MHHDAREVQHHTAEVCAACRLVTLSQLCPERPLLGAPSLSAASVTMLQSMTARAASFRGGSIHEVMTPPSPIPSIDRFSSVSSWGASCSSPGSCHGSCSSPLGHFTAGDHAHTYNTYTRARPCCVELIPLWCPCLKCIAALTCYTA